MTSFALVTEGITDQIVLESILNGFYETDVDVRPLQPTRDATDRSRQGEFGGWEIVLDYCTRIDILHEALQFNDFLIIQIDTDCAEHVNFGVTLTIEGKDKPVDQLVSEVRNVIISKFNDPSFYSKYTDRIIFAISVHSLECWLLPLHENKPKSAAKIKSCETALNRAILKKDGVYSKDARCYQRLAQGYEKRKNIDQHRSTHPSFELFLNALPALLPLE